jgi:hypothetical protein
MKAMLIRYTILGKQKPITLKCTWGVGVCLSCRVLERQWMRMTL